MDNTEEEEHEDSIDAEEYAKAVTINAINSVTPEQGAFDKTLSKLFEHSSRDSTYRLLSQHIQDGSPNDKNALSADYC